MNARESSLTFEALREAIQKLPPAADEGQRALVWVEEAHRLAVARSSRGRMEIFVVCEPLQPTDRLVADNLQHDVWMTVDGASLPANRLVLPGAPHFDGVAAFICAELLNNGVSVDGALAFVRSEPVIGLALRRATLSDAAIVGLAGELYTLTRLLAKLPDRADEIVDSWYGSIPSSRDLQLGTLGIEVKTTTRQASTHHVQGFHQLERGASVDGTPETHLFLLSLGMQWLPTDADAGHTIPRLVDSVLLALASDDDREAFLKRVQQYGGDAATGYDHRSKGTASRYGRPFEFAFERLYDLEDERLRLLRRSDVEHARHVDGESVSFRVRLPDRVRGDVNPISGMPAIVTHLASLLLR